MEKKVSATVGRILEFIVEKGISKREFANTVGISHTLIGKTNSIGSDKLENIISNYPELNPVWLLTGQGEMIKANSETLLEESSLIDENKRFLDRYFHGRLLRSHYEYTMIKYYSTFTEERIDELLSLEIDVWKERYNDWNKLIDILLLLDPPKSIAEKFTRASPTFEEFIKKSRDEFEEDVIGLKNNKLKNILFILRVKDESEHFSRAISRVIMYIDSCKVIKISRYNRDEKKG